MAMSAPARTMFKTEKSRIKIIDCMTFSVVVAHALTVLQHLLIYITL
jgi:hypothetical protein